MSFDIQKNNKKNFITNNIFNIKKGQLVVHFEHGIGIYQGLITIKTRDIISEYLVIDYADHDKLYVPISSIHLVTLYDFNHKKYVSLNKLGKNSWDKTKKKTVKKIQDIAAELLEATAQRKIEKGYPFQYNKKKYKLFCNSFPFEMTSDQKKAIHSVIDDMTKPIAMHHIVCGDVGFGKTEIAIRAAFLAVDNNKQVGILVPTTLLAQQHFNNFCDRFKNWPIKIDILSRFRNTKDQKNIIHLISQGKIDILIGTHKLLQKNIKWKNLGLLIIDEEHRFGVIHKELLNSKHKNIDILILTATPIPRTLYMAMNGLRNLSIISSPPDNRLSIKTFVYQFNTEIIRKAILKEISRNGQVYYIFNNVKIIEKRKTFLQKLIPEVKFEIGHGQMPTKNLEKIMIKFYQKKFDVLICSTIIETGIDISNVNTIIIERADKFGLAQLYQLKGRVGRSKNQAYAYLLTPNPKLMTTNSKKRLDAFKSFKDLGIGFTLATQDLEIRGSGKLLGKEQSGQITNIGIELYSIFLKNAIKLLKKGKEPTLEKLSYKSVELELSIPLFFPETYINNVNQRLLYYKKIATINSKEKLNLIKIELIKKFGMIPRSGIFILELALIRIKALEIGIKKIKMNQKKGYIEFFNENSIDTNKIIYLINKYPNVYKLNQSNQIEFNIKLNSEEDRLIFIKKLIKKLKK
ncbi:MAG: transcription-repair coupling factor [Arsenophonus sp.]|nr:MAG: transcription-repair coupling factor [Arsenophonus sp.]